MRLRNLSQRTKNERHAQSACSEKNLAVAVLKQAWQEAVFDLCGANETSRKDYTLLKEKAIEWICSDEYGFLFWCQLADMNHSVVRKKLSETLTLQYNRDGMITVKDAARVAKVTRSFLPMGNLTLPDGTAADRPPENRPRLLKKSRVF